MSRRATSAITARTLQEPRSSLTLLVVHLANHALTQAPTSRKAFHLLHTCRKQVSPLILQQCLLPGVNGADQRLLLGRHGLAKPELARRTRIRPRRQNPVLRRGACRNNVTQARWCNHSMSSMKSSEEPGYKTGRRKRRPVVQPKLRSRQQQTERPCRQDERPAQHLTSQK